MKPIGETFGAELTAAGFGGLQIVWDADGEISFGPDVTQEQRDAVAALHAAHDPNRPLRNAFIARDLIDLLTAADIAAIKAATASNADLDLLWLRLTSRSDKPVSTGSPDFTAGWAGLSQALGAARVTEITAELGLS